MIFLGLKVAEIGTVVFGPYYLGVLLEKWSFYNNNMNIDNYWISGLAFIWLICVICGFLVCLYFLLKGNWLWAKKIIKK